MGYNKIIVNGERLDEHRYIMEQQIGRRLRKDEVVHHIDGNKKNNELSNLQLMTRKEHSSLHWNRSSLSEELNRQRSKKLKSRYKREYQKSAIAVQQFSKNGEMTREYKSIMDVEQFGYDNRHVSACCNGKRKTHRGFIWKRKEV